MKFVGAPFTFGFEQVGTNCGLIGKNAAIEIDGVAYWMGNNGFFSFDGTVNTLPCSVEDYVYDDLILQKANKLMQVLIIIYRSNLVVSNIKTQILMIDMLFIIMVKIMQDYLWVIGTQAQILIRLEQVGLIH